MTMTTKIEIIEMGEPLFIQKAADAPTNPEKNPKEWTRAFQIIGESAKDRGGVFINSAELAAWQAKNRRESTSGS
jgi:hypothetical protein